MSQGLFYLADRYFNLNYRDKIRIRLLFLSQTRIKSIVWLLFFLISINNNFCLSIFNIESINLLLLFIAIRALSFLDRIIRTKLMKYSIISIELAFALFFIRNRNIVSFLSFELFLIPTILLIVYYGRMVNRTTSFRYLILYTRFSSLPLFFLLNNLVVINCRINLIILSFFFKVPILGFHLWLPYSLLHKSALYFFFNKIRICRIVISFFYFWEFNFSSPFTSWTLLAVLLYLPAKDINRRNYLDYIFPFTTHRNFYKHHQLMFVANSPMSVYRWCVFYVSILFLLVHAFTVMGVHVIINFNPLLPFSILLDVTITSDKYLYRNSNLAFFTFLFHKVLIKHNVTMSILHKSDWITCNGYCFPSSMLIKAKKHVYKIKHTLLP